MGEISKPKLLFGYWRVRGLMQPIRYFCEYAQIEYEEKFYEGRIVDNTLDKSDWLQKKHTLGLDFPNLPYMFDLEASIKLTQSDAIYKYIAKKFKPETLGKTLIEQAHVDQILGVLHDVRFQLIRLRYGSSNSYETQLAICKEKATETCQELINFKKQKKYLVGDYITIADISCFAMFENVRKSVPNFLSEQPSLKTDMDAYMDSIASIPAIKSYQASPKFIDIITVLPARGGSN